MKQPTATGRVDHLAQGIFENLLRRYANPHVRFACRMLSKEIGQCFEQHLGPGTKAHEVGSRFANAARRFD